MKHSFLIIALIFCVISSNSQTSIESYDVLSDDNHNISTNYSAIRYINGGSVITPEFDESCPEEMKAPFSFACKLLEEYLPPCLPLRVQISCGRLSGSYRNSVSKVSITTKEYFGAPQYPAVPLSTIKGVIMAEFAYGHGSSYLDYVPDLDFLISEPDIKITYNTDYIDQLSFSLHPDASDQYDFVTIVMRDILKGLGFSSGFMANYVTGNLECPAHMTPFEFCILQTLDTNGDSSTWFDQATQGEFMLSKTSKTGPMLYAPTKWQNGVSLNYFMPSSGSDLPNILTYDFGKGYVWRSLNDRYASLFFSEYLGWTPQIFTSVDSPGVSTAGSNALLMPYQGSMLIDDSSYGLVYQNLDENQSKKMQSKSDDPNALYYYINEFKPFLTGDEVEGPSGCSVAVLKKDGTWDVVKYYGYYTPGTTYYMSDWTFHSDLKDYARSVDGYLRARMTIKERSTYGFNYISKFFVIDNLPQNIELGYNYISAPKSLDLNNDNISSETCNVRLFFKNTEGIKRIILEKLRAGSRLPSKMEILDFKKGYFDTTIDKNTTFTAVAYNDNGNTRGEPLYIEYLSPDVESSDDIEIQISENSIDIKNVNPETNYNFTISTLTSPDNNSVIAGKTDRSVDISTLATGIHVIRIENCANGSIKSFKFIK